MKKPWLQMYLRELSRTSVRLMAGELIDPILDWVRTKSDFGKGKSKGKGRQTEEKGREPHRNSRGPPKEKKGCEPQLTWAKKRSKRKDFFKLAFPKPWF